MTLAQQLNELQEIDLAIGANEQAQARISGQLGDSREVARIKARLVAEQKRLDELVHQQHSLEWEAENLSAKITATEEKLFGGSIRNPKELSNLQRENDDLKVRRERLEDRVLGLMDEVEAVTAFINNVSVEMARLQAEWKEQQQKLSGELEQLGKERDELGARRNELTARIEPGAVETYQKIKAQKGTAVARVEQGRCRGCQMTLPTTELQQVRGGGMVRCSSCGRILYLP